MSVSRFRHSTGHVAKPQRQFLNITSSTAMWDGSNTITCNDLFVAVPWQTFGGTAIFTHDSYGKVAPNPPIVLGQEGPIIDVAFDPFDNQKLFTASEDGSVFGWEIPAEGLTSNVSTPLVELKGHNKKCGILAFHPSAKGVLGSAAVDRVINIWDVERSTAVTAINSLSDYATGLDWNLDGSLICTTSRNKRLSVLDPRDGSVVSSVESHSGTRSQRCVWTKRKNMIMTFGWNDSQQRQIKLWDSRKLSSAYNAVVLDQSSAAFMPMYDEDTSLLFLGSKGENNVKCYELMDEGLTFSFEVSTIDPVKGLGRVPKWCLDVKRCEFDRLYQLTSHSLLTIDMVIPRKQAGLEFQSDVFPPTFANKPALTAGEFFGGADASPRECDLAGLFDGLSPRVCSAESKTPDARGIAKRPSDTTGVGKEPRTVKDGQRDSHSATADGKTDSATAQRAPAGIAPGAEKHVDPVSDMTQREFTQKATKMKELAEKLRVYHQEIAALRKALQEKETEMVKILEDFQTI